MSQPSSQPIAIRPEAIPGQVAQRRLVLISAWAATLLLSKLPLVVARELLGGDIPWINSAWVGTAAVFIASTFLIPVLKPLRAYLIIMGTIALITLLGDPLRGSAAWQGFTENQSTMMGIFLDRIALVLETLIVLAVLFLLGYRRKEAFLAAGDLAAPVGGPTASGKRRPLNWAVLGAVSALLLGGMFFAFMSTQTPGGFAGLSAVLPWIPLVLISAALNAFGEEAKYRSAPLATLVPVVPAGHAIWMTSLWFGLGHYYGGTPSGVIGLVYSGLLALLLGKAMVDTRGIAWPWIIHAVIDAVIYLFMAAG